MPPCSTSPRRGASSAIIRRATGDDTCRRRHERPARRRPPRARQHRGRATADRFCPPAAYTDPAFFALERELVFRRHWISVAFAHEIPDPGDAMPIDAAGVPLVLLRDREGEIRAFHNVCRHRGSAILSAPVKGQPTLRCPYHGWAYGLDGRLRATPLWDGKRATPPEALDRADLALAPVRCGVWADIVFVDLSGT